MKIKSITIITLFLVFSLLSLALTTNKNKITICIQPFDGLKSKYSKSVLNKLILYYPHIIINKPITLPQSTYYSPRNRYRADLIIKYLKNITKKNCITIGMTNKDISTTKGKYYDWGVMGLGYCPGVSCVVSTYRLSKKNINEQLFKVSIHEIGHTQGLKHCNVKSCFMRDAQGSNPLDYEKDFCKNCKSTLSKKGWIFK